MAFGDPMVLRTLYNAGISANVAQYDSLLTDGPFDDGVTNNAWTWQPSSGEIPTITSASGVRTGGVSGGSIHRLTFSSRGVGTMGDYYQAINLRGNDKLQASGHNGQTFQGSMWIRRTDATAGDVTATLKLQEGVNVTNGSSQLLSSDGTWYQLTVSRALTGTTGAASLEFYVRLVYAGVGGGSPVIEVDEAMLYLSYTFAVNPSIPDTPKLMPPFRTLQRTPGGKLVVHRSGALQANKHEYTLNFGLIGLAQLKTLRSLWLLDAPMEWQPNLPHLPTYLDVRFSGDFDLRLRSPNVNANNYAGTLTLVEI